MEHSVNQDTEAAAAVIAPAINDNDLLFKDDSKILPKTDDLPHTESSVLSSTLDSDLFDAKYGSSSSQAQPSTQVKDLPFVSNLETKDIETHDPKTISVVKDFLEEARGEPIEVSEKPNKESELFGFNKPLPLEPYDSSSDFLKSQTSPSPVTVEVKDDINQFVGGKGDESPIPLSREDSPIPPPIPKHQNLRDESPDRFESSPEPEFKPMEPSKDDDELFKPQPVIPPKQEVKAVPKKEDNKANVADIGAKDIIVEIDAWFNPARLHPQVESLVYWRDPKKSGAVFGVIILSLLSLTCFSLISVVAYFGLLALAGTISFRIYKNIMQAVQKTSDGHPFKEYLDMEISLPEDKVAETSRVAAQQINAAISALRSLFLVEDLVDSIKGLVLFWSLTYVGAVFNGLTLIIIGVILIFSLPRLYEKNKAQVDAYIQIGMDKLSIITNRMKAAMPSSKKDEKPKDQ